MPYWSGVGQGARWSRGLAVVLGLGLLVGPATAQAATPPDAERRAARAAAEVDRLTGEYLRISTRANQALAAYTASFSADVTAEAAQERSRLQVEAARSARTRTVRALYASGGAVGLTGSVLTAGSADEAIWRLGTSRRLLGAVLARRGSDLVQAQQAAASADQQAGRTEAGRSATASQLAEVQAEQERADRALDRARAVLAGLDRQVAGLRAARAAAARLRAAQERGRDAQRSAPAAAAADIPSSFAAAYRNAATTCPGMEWTLLAAVGQVESRHGRNNGPSSAGAIGPMQFMPRTFAAFAVDGDGDGRRDPWDTEDAVFSAANYLCHSGAGEGEAGVRRALFAYNRAQWYVELVLGARRSIRGRFG